MKAYFVLIRADNKDWDFYDDVWRTQEDAEKAIKKYSTEKDWENKYNHSVITYEFKWVEVVINPPKEV